MVFFRADSNTKIASGHIMRCLSIADELRSRGNKVTFISADNNSESMVSSAGFPLIVLNSKWDNLKSEIPAMQKLLSDYPNSLLIIDTYQATKNYIRDLVSFAKICYLGSKKELFGDISLLVNYSTDINYSFYHQAYDASKTRLLLGPKYAPLRKEFQNIYHPLSMRMEHVLITTGNTDPENIIGKLLTGLKSLPFFEALKVDVVVGRMFVHAAELLHSFEDISNIVLHQNVNNMSELMIKSDVAISANGTTVYELAAANVPAITFAMVPEQIGSAEALANLGAVNYCGETYADKDDVLRKILMALSRYYSFPEERIALADKAHSIINGDGCKYIADEVMNMV